MEDNDKANLLTVGTGEGSLGVFLVASSDKGIRAILLGDSKDALVEELGREFPYARCVSGGSEYDSVIIKVGHLIEHPAAKLELPLDTGGGDFEQLTRAAIRATCAGKTVSHAEIARMIGASPESARSVAEVCAKNIIAVAIPCHRVEGADGSGSRYRWGESRRRVLLEREKTYLS
jgi:AraC family transcriptional regulator of adaptative response/methylated-DNA-[protein]-cysteine methyltransferase